MSQLKPGISARRPEGVEPGITHPVDESGRRLCCGPILVMEKDLISRLEVHTTVPTLQQASLLLLRAHKPCHRKSMDHVLSIVQQLPRAIVVREDPARTVFISALHHARQDRVIFQHQIRDWFPHQHSSFRIEAMLLQFRHQGAGSSEQLVSRLNSRMSFEQIALELLGIYVFLKDISSFELIAHFIPS